MILTFSIGLRDGVNFDDSEHTPNGVLFAIEIAGERVFEDVSTTCQWSAEQVIDLSRFANQTIQIAFITNCNGDGNSNYDWALWGTPRVLLLRTVEFTDASPSITLTRGIVLGQLEGEPTQYLCYEYNFPEGKDVMDMASLSQQLCEAIPQIGEWVETENVVCLTVYAYQPQLQIISLGPTTGMVVTGKDFEARCVVRNIGKVALREADKAFLALSGIKLKRDRIRKPLGSLEPQSDAAVTWRVLSFHRETTVQMTATLKASTTAGVLTDETNAMLVVERDVPRLPAKAGGELHAYEHGKNIVIENDSIRVIFVHGATGYGYYTLSTVRNGNYQQVATSYPLSAFTYRGTDGAQQSVTLRPTEYQLTGNNQGEAAVIFTEQKEDTDGVSWHFRACFSLAERSKRISVEYQLRAEQDRELVYWGGPMLRAGDGGYGTKKDFALFPGLEYLSAEEVSSSTRDAAPPINLRLTPHPCKITIPLMAVEYERCLVGLLWNPILTWDEENNMPSALFASPNWHERQDNHLMGVFLPAVPDWIQENQQQAEIPYSLKANTELKIHAQIVVDNKRGSKVAADKKDPAILDAITHWTDAYGMPEPMEPPRVDEEELLLSRHALMHTVWDEETQKSRHCVDWAPTNAPGFATLLWYDYLATHDANVKERVELIAQNTIRDTGAGGLASTALCHILKWEFPFYYGYIEDALTSVKETVENIIANQDEDGSWRFQPNERTENLGSAGDAVLGTCAVSALIILKYARITGDETALQAGKKALDFMDRFTIPRGAQAWECPLYEPDILAAAYAVGAYVESYRITQEKHYLERAEYWALTGLPFLYFWNLKDRPGMRFGSIPVFGTTFYTHSWFGVPVQWNGLVYAYHLQHLAEYSSVFPWQQIAEGISVSAMHQQWTAEPLKGTYPDGFYGYCTEGRGPHINPEDIMVNLYALRGVDPDISTAILQGPDGQIHISSGARAENAELVTTEKSAESETKTQTLSFNLRYVPDETSFTVIYGFGKMDTESSFYTIATDSKTLPEDENIQELPEGWYYRPEQDAVYLKVAHPTEIMNITVQRGEIPEQPAEPISPQEEEIETPEQTVEEQPAEETSEQPVEKQPVEETLPVDS